MHTENNIVIKLNQNNKSSQFKLKNSTIAVMLLVLQKHSIMFFKSKL